MRIILASLALGAAVLPVATSANIVQQDERGFRVMHIVETDASPQEVWRTLAEPSRWWNGDHTYAGDAGNLALDLVPGGCFCEHAEGLSVEHARVIYSEPGVRLRMIGSLGPLQQDAVTGVLNFAFRERADGGTTISFEYSVSGNFRMAVGTLAPAVDRVITEQANGLAEAATDAPALAAPDPDGESEAGQDEFGETFEDTPEPEI